MKGFFLIASLFFLGHATYAQESSATMNIEVQIVEGMSLSLSRNLDFGEVVAGTGTVSINRQSNDAGKFVLAGGGNSTITVSYSMPANNQLLRAEGEGELQLVAALYGGTEDNPGTAIEILDGSSITLGDDGSYYFFVEGSLDVGPVETNPAGTYSGVLTMVIAYQ